MGVRFEVRDNVIKEIHKVVVHRFKIYEFEELDLHAADPIWKWQNSEKGKFVLEHAISAPEYKKKLDHISLGYEYAIIAELEKKRLSEFYLRFDKLK